MGAEASQPLCDGFGPFLRSFPLRRFHARWGVRRGDNADPELIAQLRRGVVTDGKGDSRLKECLTDGLGLRGAFLGPFAVEATNGSSVEEDLTKFGDGIRALMADVCRPYDGPGSDDVAAIARGVEELFAGAAHADVVAYRDEMVAALRRLKDAQPFPAPGAAA